jgi:ribulose-phosphate 3-epimerase
VIPAIIAETQYELTYRLQRVIDFSEVIMLDVMDGKFVEANSLNFEPELPKKLTYQLHLMVRNPHEYALRLRGKAGTVIIHLESLKRPTELNNFRLLGFNIFIAMNPSTSVEDAFPYLDSVDGVLVMTVEPGRYGSPFLVKCLEKVTELKARMPKLVVEVDGGLNPKRAKMAKLHGAELFAVGSYIFNSSTPEKAFRELERSVSGETGN